MNTNYDSSESFTNSLELYHCAERGTSEQVRLLVNYSDANVNATFQHNKTPLHAAVSRANVESVKLLIGAGADVNMEHTFGYKNTAMHTAAYLGNVECLQLLFDNKANINAANNEMKITPLHAALLRGRPRAVKFLLENGADPLAKDANGETPLDYAEDHPECLKLFATSK